MDEAPFMIGRSFEPFAFVIDQAKVDELCFALRDTNPLFKRSERTPIPPTFLNSSIQTFITGRNPVDLLGISRRRALHAGQSYEYLADVYVGDALVGQTVLTQVVEKKGRTGVVRFITLETRFTRDGQEVVVVQNRVAQRMQELSQ